MRNGLHPYTTAVILAAGSGKRAEGAIPKQFVIIDGIPVVIRTLMAFEECELIDEIIVICAEGDDGFYGEYIEKYSLKKVSGIVCGGDCRAESAKRGVMHTGNRTEFVAIHDAARCAIDPRQISAVVSAAYDCKAAIAAVKITDTVKTADDEGFISGTVDRATVWRAQTPQVFSKELYIKALEKRKLIDSSLTDDASLVEAVWKRIRLVDCGESNMKITYPRDFEKVRLILGAK